MTKITDLPSDEEGKFLLSEFAKIYKGFFYGKTYRNENKSVQLLYTQSGETATFMTQILEGEGIRVADISYQGTKKGRCVMYENSVKPSVTARDVAAFFGCVVKREQRTGPYDIIIELGEREGEWSTE